MKKKFKIRNKFSFNLVSTETIERIINDADIKKASSGEIQTYLSFSDSLKYGNARPLYKEKDLFDKKNYRSVSILHFFFQSLWKSDVPASVELF